MPKTLRETIKKTVRTHLLDHNGLAFGQCLTAVGWVGGTLPELYEKDGMIELSMADVAGGGIVAGAALAGRRPIYVIRYQGFNWFNAPIILNYACKSKEMWSRPCPVFIRSVAMEGSIGPVAGSSHHSLYYRMPGVNIVSPMTSGEYREIYDHFMKHDDVMYVSEHRGAFGNDKELDDVVFDDSDIVLFPISVTRFEAIKASRILETMGIKASILHQLWLKPFIVHDKWKEILKCSKFGGLVLDDDYVDGVPRLLAHRLSYETGKRIDVMGLDDRTAGFAPHLDNLPPSADKIVERVLSLVRSTT